DQLLLRMRVSNLISENRIEDFFRVVERLREIGPPEADFRLWIYNVTGMADFSRRDAPLQAGALQPAAGSVSEELFALSNDDLLFLRHESRYLEVKGILDASKAETLRFG